jgi:gamma-glutamylcyclotransferase (GGCT)/AIG2-like uncharacterized protein YtfP
MLLFAYGSNLDFKQTRARCPSAQFVAKALLTGHRLYFPRYGSNWDCGVASVDDSDGDHVWGVVYDIADDDVPKMDTSEGFNPNRHEEQNSYNRVSVCVLLDGNAASPVAAFTYIAVPQPNPQLPNANYREAIVRGARAWKLPNDYVNMLEAIRIS